VTWTAFVVSLSNTARTQNGHIRNDTRVVSRRILSVLTSPDLQEKVCRECFFVQTNLHEFQRAVGMEPFTGLTGSDNDRIGPIRRDGLPGTDFASRALVRARRWARHGRRRC
jgi:hypothetical protein